MIQAFVYLSANAGFLAMFVGLWVIDHHRLKAALIALRKPAIPL
jgi:hypothetical protein